MTQANLQTICYCFRHTVQSIHAEVRDTGRSTVVAAVAAKVKAGECDCKRLHPEGRCCLGDLRRVAKEALGAAV